MIRILFLAANPVGTAELQLIKEYKYIDEQLRKTKYRDQFDLEQEHAVSVTELQELLQRYEPNIVHFSGHGSEEHALILEGADGQPEMVTERALSNLFKILNQSRNIRCILLNACYSEKQAGAIAKYVDSVIGMSSDISDAAARRFAISFYQALGYGKSLKEAFDLGCNSLELLNIPEEHVPKLKCTSGVDPAKVFLLSNDEDAAKEAETANNKQVSHNAGKASRSNINQQNVGKIPLEGFQPFGRWHVESHGPSGETFTMSVEFASDGFRGQGQGHFSAVGMSVEFQVAGSWLFNPQTQMLDLQGIMSAAMGQQPILMSIHIEGQKDNGYYGTGTDGFSYYFTPE